MPTRPRAVGAFLLLLSSSACGAANSAQKPTGTPDLTEALPAPTLSPFGVAYGRRQPGVSGRHEPRANLEPYLRRARVAAGGRTVARASSRPQTGVVKPAPASAATSSTPLQVSTPRVASTAIADNLLYAQRENKSKDLQRFRGGDVVVIGVSTLVVVLLIVLLIVLLL